MKNTDIQNSYTILNNLDWKKVKFKTKKFENLNWEVRDEWWAEWEWLIVVDWKSIFLLNNEKTLEARWLSEWNPNPNEFKFISYIYSETYWWQINKNDRYEFINQV